MNKLEAIKGVVMLQSILMDAIAGDAGKDELQGALIIAQLIQRKLKELPEDEG